MICDKCHNMLKKEITLNEVLSIKQQECLTLLKWFLMITHLRKGHSPRWNYHFLADLLMLPPIDWATKRNICLANLATASRGGITLIYSREIPSTSLNISTATPLILCQLALASKEARRRIPPIYSSTVPYLGMVWVKTSQYRVASPIDNSLCVSVGGDVSVTSSKMLSIDWFSGEKLKEHPIFHVKISGFL